jgi:hypothetical protein
MIDYPTTQLRLADPETGPRIPLLVVMELILAMGLGAVAVALGSRGWQRVRSRRRS